MRQGFRRLPLALALALGLTHCGGGPGYPAPVESDSPEAPVEVEAEAPDGSEAEKDALGGGSASCTPAVKLRTFPPVGAFFGAFGTTAVNDDLFFTADDGVHGRELWVSDGTVAGTRMVKDILPPGSFAAPSFLTEAGGLLYFVVEETLWRSDGTEAGTFALVTSSAPGTLSPLPFTEYRGKLVFANTSVKYGSELWVSDGTPGGTRLLLDVNPGPAGSFVFDLLVTDDDDLVFSASRGAGTAARRGLYKRTLSGKLLELFRAPGDETSVFRLQQVGDRTFFLVDASDGNPFLWVSNGRPGGARELANFGDVSTPRRFTAFKNKLYFVAEQSDDGAGSELWVSDGTPGGTRRLADIYPGEEGSVPDDLAVFKGRLYFSANDGTHGRELWRTDGTTSGTKLVKDLWPGPMGSDPDGLVDEANKLFFAANDGVHGREPWKRFDGTLRLLEDIVPGPAGSDPRPSSSGRGETGIFVRAGPNLFFAAGPEGRELWVMKTAAYCPPPAMR